jgi:NADH ubiquinone oxidoreductase, 20 Kd subunit
MRKTLLESLTHGPLTEPSPGPDEAALAELAKSVNRAAHARLGRSLSIRQVDAGSCNGCELEIHALNNAFYDLERFGLRFVASPRHADVLMVTGPVTKNMREALLRTYNATLRSGCDTNDIWKAVKTQCLRPSWPRSAHAVRRQEYWRPELGRHRAWSVTRSIVSSI